LTLSWSKWRGDASAARDCLGASWGLLPATVGPAVVPLLRAAARLTRSEGDPLESVSLACDGLEAAFQAGALLAVLELLELVAMASSDLGRTTEAARLLGAVERQREVIGYIRGLPAAGELAAVVLAIETALGPDGIERSWSEGRAMGVPEAVAYARRGRGRRGRPAVGWVSLTPTEREVALLVAQRLGNTEIGARVFISTVTVNSHLTRAFTKLGVRNRSQLADVAAGHAQNERRAR
jgi:DNA-binding CsgD family transcriptional regulator